MKKFKRGIFIIISILLFFRIFVSGAMAYSTSDYSIDIPPGFIQSGNGFINNSNGNSFNVNIKYVGYFDNFRYDEAHLSVIVDTLEEYGRNFLLTTLQDYFRTNYADYYYEIQNQLNLLDYSYEILDKDIIKFSDNNYKGFYIKTRLGIEDYYTYGEQYCVYSNGYQYILTLSSEDNSYFNSIEAQSIIDSFTIKNFVPVDDNMTTEELLPIVAVIVIIIFVIIFLLSKKSKRYNNGSVNFDEYNVGNSNEKFNIDNSNTKKIEENRNIKQSHVDFSRFCYIENCVEFIDLIQNKWSLLPYYNKDNEKRIIDFNDFYNLKTDTAKVIFTFNLLMDINDLYSKYRIYISMVKIIDKKYLIFSNSMLNEYTKLLDELRECVKQLKGKDSFVFFENIVISIYENHLELLSILGEINKIIEQQLLLNASQPQITFVIDKLGIELMEVTDKYADKLTELGTALSENQKKFDYLKTLDNQKYKSIINQENPWNGG